MNDVNAENAAEVAKTVKGGAVVGPSTVRRSPSVTALAGAMVKVQAEIEDPTKNKKADAGKRQYTYADLPTVLDAVRPTLVKFDLAVVQLPCECNGGPALTTILIHKSGEWIETTICLRPGDNSPQSVGSALTYARRYALLSLCGVAADDDDDGKAGGQPAQQQRQREPQKTLAEQCYEAVVKATSRDELMGIYRHFDADVKAGKFTDAEKGNLDAAFKATGAKFPPPQQQTSKKF